MDEPHLAIEPPQNRDRQEADRPVYLITFVCYGTWLPGQAGAVDRSHNRFGSRLREPDPVEEQRARRRMLSPLTIWMRRSAGRSYSRRSSRCVRIDNGPC